MEFRVLGPLEVIGPNGSIAIGSGRQRAILAMLVLHIGETVSSERLIDEVWADDPPSSAQHALEVHVSGLRRALGPGRIETHPSGYRLRSEGSRVDLRRFESLVADASVAFSEGDPRAAAARLTAALALWRGPALADVAGGATASAAGTRLDELHAVVLEQRIDAGLESGSHLELIPELRSLVADMPLREAFRSRLMLALYRSGRQADALAAYHEAREVLDRDLGVEPGPELEAMQRAVLGHDTSLDLGAREVPASLRAGQARLTPERRRERPASTMPLDSRRRAARRTVTVLMADLSGSTRLGEPLDPESARDPLDRCFDEIQAVLERHGATIERGVGDAVMGVFGIPVNHEDDALRAARAASEMRTAIALLNDVLEHGAGMRVEMRIGLNTGEVVAALAGEPAVPLRGHAVNIASRLQQAAGAGEILVGERTRHLLRDAVEVGEAESIELKGKAEPVIAYRLEHVAGAPGHRRLLEGPIVGRGRELGELRTAFEHTVLHASSQLVTILGAAGVGKSRLVAEFLGQVRDRARVVQGRCLSYGAGITYWPIAEIVRQAAGIAGTDPADAIRARIDRFVAGLPEAAAVSRGLAVIVGLEGATTQDELFWAFRRAMEHLAAERPLVILVEDVHWAEPTLVDLLESVADRTQDASILLLCPARQEGLADRPGMARGKIRGTTILLGPLEQASALDLIDSLVPPDALRPGVRSRIAGAAEGNPLYVEEFLEMLIDRGALVGDDAGDTAPLDLVSIGTPPTIQALLSARLDRLAPEERAVAERASVVGRVFDRPSVIALSPVEERPEVPRMLASLVREAVIGHDPARAARDETFRFRHALIRDAAYEGLPKADRAELHEQLGDWLDLTAAEPGAATEELVGYHLERASRLRTELAPADDSGRDLARRAATRLIAAGRRALARSDIGATVNLYGRAQSLLQPTDPARLAILPDFARALDSAGRTAESKATFAEAVARAEAVHDDRALAHARIQQQLSGTAGPGAGAPAQRRVAAECIAIFERYRDVRGLAFAWHLDGAAALGTADGEPSLAGALEYARAANDHHEETAIILGLSAELFQGPTPIPEAIRRCEGILAGAPDDRAIEMAMDHALAHLRARLGEFTVARQLAARCQEIAEESGQPWRAAFLAEVAWDVEMLAGDYPVAQRIIAEAFDRIAAMGQSNSILERCLTLSNIALGREVDLDRFTELTTEQVGWHRAVLEATLAAAHLNAAHLPEAERHARNAVDFFAETAFLTLHADAVMILATVLRAADRPRDADAAFEQALDLYRRKRTLVTGQTPTAQLAAWAFAEGHRLASGAARR